MKEKEYIKYLSKNFKGNNEVITILENYFNLNINFEEVVEEVSSLDNKSVMTYKTWIKSKKIDDLLS